MLKVNEDSGAHFSQNDCTFASSETEEMVSAIRRKDAVIAELEQEKLELQEKIMKIKNKNEGDGGQIESLGYLYNMVKENAGGASYPVVALDVSKNADSLGFMLGIDSDDQPLVKRCGPDCKLEKGDRFLEANGKTMFNKTENEVYRAFKDCHENPVKVVVMRSRKDDNVNDCDAEMLKEDLALALLEVESLQKENGELTEKLEIVGEQRK